MTGVDWEKAYRDLESHIGQIMEETSALVNNASPKLRINDVHVRDAGGTLEVIIDATGNRMTYAVYVTDRKGRMETLKLPYQLSNTFNLDVPKGRYTVQGFARQHENDLDIVSEKVSINFKKDDGS
ncbi:hypothetical protein [Salinicoccus carnicancri]|uniref:hypothetical protein n=1 Tax=Salinicoccus carnicancri TaxID=558170 RepID=UPI0002D657D7|nr:hypothetical protein [Salinicoccus carnicancri]